MLTDTSKNEQQFVFLFFLIKIITYCKYTYLPHISMIHSNRTNFANLYGTPRLFIVMEPVSSTIEPISIYKLVPKVNANDNSKYEKNTLLTGKLG